MARRALRIAVWIAGMMVAAALAIPSALILYARTDGGRERVRDLALAQARKTVPGLQIGRIGGDYLHDLALHDVSVVDGAGRRAVHVDEVFVRFDLIAVLRHTVLVRELRVEGPSVLGRPEADGTLNLAHLVKPAAESGERPAKEREGGRGGKPWHLRIERLRVVGGEADVEMAEGAGAVVAGLFLEASGAVDDGMLGAYELRLGIDQASIRAAGAQEPTARLALSLAARGEGVPLAPGSHSRASLELAPSRVAGVRIGRVRLTASTDGERWELPRALVHASGATLAVAAHGAGPHLVADLEAAIAGALRDDRRSPLPDIRGQGRLSLHVEGTPGRAMTVRAQLDGHRLAVGGGSVETVALEARAALEQPPRGGLMAPRGTLRLRARGLRPGPDLPPIDWLTVDGASGPRGLTVRAAARGQRVQAALEAHGQLTERAARVTLDRLSVAYESRAYKQQLALARPATLAYRARDGLEVSPLEVRGTGYLLTGTVVAGGTYRPAARARQTIAELSLALRHASLAGFDPIDAELRASLERRRATAVLDATVARGRVHLDADLPLVTPRRGPPRLARRGPIAVRFETAALALQNLPVLQHELASQGLSGGTVTAQASVTGDMARPVATAALDVRDLLIRNLVGLGRDSKLKTIPGVGASLRLDTRPGSIHLAATALLRKTGVLRVEARSDVELGALLAGASPGAALAAAPIHAELEIPKLALASLAEITDTMKGVEGTLAGRIEVTGTPRRPSGRADLTIDGARVDQVAFRQVLLHGEADDGRIDLAVKLAEANGGDLYARARIDRSRGDALSGHLGAQNVDIGLARPFLHGVRELGGTLRATADVTGTVAAPRLTGSLSLQKGRVGVIGQPTFQDVEVAASLRPGRAELGRLSMRSGGGTLTGQGWVVLEGLSPRSMVFTAHADRFLVAASGQTGARIDGDLAVEGALRDAVLSGQVRVPRAVVWLPKVGGGGRDLQSTAAHADLRFVDAAAQAAAARAAERRNGAGQPLRLDVHARAGPVYVRSKDLDLELESHLHVTTAPDGQPALAGQVHVRRGRINISGQRFEFERGDITFDGSPQPNPHLDIRLTRSYPEATVVIEIRGTPKKPELRLASDPPIYDDAQIVSLLLTGHATGQPSTGKGFDPKAAVATMVLGKLADKLAPELGLDVLSVGTVEKKTNEGVATGDTDTRVEVGKYISDRVYMSYAHVFGAPENANSNEAHVEYRLTRRWMLETIFGDAGVGSLDALWTYRY